MAKVFGILLAVAFLLFVVHNIVLPSLFPNTYRYFWWFRGNEKKPENIGEMLDELQNILRDEQ